LAAPTNLKVRVTGRTRVNFTNGQPQFVIPAKDTITWSWSGTGAAPSFELYRSLDPSTLGQGTAIPIAANVFTYTDTLPTVTPSADPPIYYYMVRPIRSGATSTDSAKAYAPQMYFVEGNGDDASGGAVQLNVAQYALAEVHYWALAHRPAITDLPANGPMVLGGFSFGGDAALHLSQQLNMVQPTPRAVQYMAFLDPVTPGWTNSHDATDFTLPLNVVYAEDWCHTAPEDVFGLDANGKKVKIGEVPPVQITGGGTPRMDKKNPYLNYIPVGAGHGDQVYQSWVYNAVDGQGNSLVPTRYPLNGTIAAGIRANLDLLPWITP